MPRGMVLWSAKVPKALCQSSNVASQCPRSSKNSGTLFCSFLLSESLGCIFAKPLRFRFGGAICSFVQLLFDSSATWD